MLDFKPQLIIILNPHFRPFSLFEQESTVMVLQVLGKSIRHSNHDPSQPNHGGKRVLSSARTCKS